MITFKITNITNLLGKRGFKNNSVVEAEYVDGMIKKKLEIKPQETVYLTLKTLPLSIHRLRIKGLVTVTEISKKEMKAILVLEKQKEKTKIVVEPTVINKEEVLKLNKEENSEDNVESKTTKKTIKKSTKKEEDEIVDGEN